MTLPDPDSVPAAPSTGGYRHTWRDTLLLLLATALLWALHLYGRWLPTPALAAAWAILTLLIGNGLFWRSRIRRQAFLAVYLAPASPLQRWLRGGWLMASRQFLVAALLALLLLVALLRIRDPRVWIALVCSIPVLTGLQWALHRRLAAHVNPRYRSEFCRRLALLMVAPVLLGVLLALSFTLAYPDFTGVGLERAVWHLVDQQQARSDGARTLLQLAAAMDGVRLWLAQQLMPQPGVSLVQGLGWLLVVAEESLFVWSYLLLCHGILVGTNSDDRAVR